MSLLLLFGGGGGGGGPACTPTEPPTGDALKLETGDHLLLESCDHLLLDVTPPEGLRLVWLRPPRGGLAPTLSYQYRSLRWSNGFRIGLFWDGTNNPDLCDPNWSNIGIAVNCATTWSSSTVAQCSTTWDSPNEPGGAWDLVRHHLEGDWTADDPSTCLPTLES